MLFGHELVSKARHERLNSVATNASRMTPRRAMACERVPLYEVVVSKWSVEPSVKRTTPEAPLQTLSTARRLRAELHQNVLAMRKQRSELHQRAIELKARRESLQRVARLIRAEVGDAADDPRDSARPRGDVESILRTLTQRQRRVLEGVLAGRANKVIAFDLGVSTKTVETHRARVMAKFHVGSLADLVRACMAAARCFERPEDLSAHPRSA